MKKSSDSTQQLIADAEALVGNRARKNAAPMTRQLIAETERLIRPRRAMWPYAGIGAGLLVAASVGWFVIMR